LSVAATVGLLLVGCGGGGSGGGTPAPQPVPNQSPTASFTATPSTGGAPLEVVFNGLTSNDPDGSIVTFDWDFGDPNDPEAVAIGATARHTFATPGTYTIQLTVTDDDSASGSRTGTVTVSASAGDFTLSGTIRILPSSAIDSDVNDTSPEVNFVRNDEFATAQALSNPVTLGGYLNAPGAGPAGRLQAGGDPRDRFRVDLTGNENIMLAIGEPGSADLDLALYDANEVLIDASMGSGASEALQVTVPGVYFVEVNLFDDGASTYVLTIGQTPVTTAGERPARLSDEFVPGEVLVSSSADPAQRHALVSASRQGRLHRVRIPADGTPATFPRNTMHARSVRDADKLATLRMIKALERDPDVEFAEPNYIRRASATPNDSFYGFQWHYPSIALPVAWDLIEDAGLPNGDGAIVAVVDTGVLLEHPDLTGQVLRDTANQVIGFDFISDPVRANDGDGIDANPDDPGDQAFGVSGSFHGTHVAGTIAAQTTNGIGVAGVAWNAKIMPLRVLGIDGGTSFDVIQAVLWAAGLVTSPPPPPQRADVINLSLGGGGSSQSEQQAFDRVRNAGVIVVAAAGNNASTLPSYPAAYNGVVSVSATTITKSLASYSNRGSTVDVAAPGGDNASDVNGDGLGDGVVSTFGDNASGPTQFGYAALNGTSMSTPHVAGVVALMKAIFPGLTPAQFESALSAGRLTDDLGAPGRDDFFGHGLINARNAVLEAIELANGAGAPLNPVLTATPTSLNFGAFDTELEVQLKNAGGGSLDVQPQTPDVPWLTIEPLDPVTLDTGDSTTYRILVDRSGLPDGTHSGDAIFDSGANDVTVPVVMQVTSLDLAADAGVHYVVLVDAATGDSLPGRFDVVEAVNGAYAFAITGVAAGQYRIAAGTDSDNDNFLCDGGEACGFYRTLDSPDTLSINGSRSDLDFTSGFRVNLFNQAGETAAATAVARRHRIIEAPPQ